MKFLVFLSKRLLQSFLVMFVVSLISFSLFNFVGDPVNGMLGDDFSQQERSDIRYELGLDDPAPVQYARFIYNIIQGDFGISFRIKRPVLDIILEKFSATFELALVATMLTVFIGIGLGVYTGVNRNTWLGRFILSVSLTGVSIPTFITGIFILYFFSVYLNILPSFGRSGTVVIWGWRTSLLTFDGWSSIIMPAITLSLYPATVALRLVRAEMINIMRTDFVTFARARGLPKRNVYFTHALRNTLLPVITIIGLNIGTLFAHAIITETIFQWPGMGLMFIQAIDAVDIPILSAYLFFVAFLFVIINFIVDLSYFIIDPRIRL